MSEKDDLFRSSAAMSGDFNFDEKVAAVFDDMLNRSVPLYSEIIRMNVSMLLKNEAVGRITDLGCSTGLLADALFRSGYRGQYTGIDGSAAMIRHCNSRNLPADFEFVAGDILSSDIPQSSAIVMNFTLQFIRPLHRLALLKNIRNALIPGGMFILSEKVLEKDSGISRDFLEHHLRYKAANGYSETEIARKRESLENVLIPYRMDENESLLAEAGFSPVALYFKWFNFAGWIAYRTNGR